MSTTSAYSSYSTATAIGGGTNPRNSVFGKRQLNRFSWFVTTGVEEFILTGGATAANNTSTKNTKLGSTEGYSSSTLDTSRSNRNSAAVVPDIYDRSPPNSAGGPVRQLYGPGGSMRSNSGGSGGSAESKTSDDSEEEEEVTESDKHYVQSGPSWQQKAPLFKVRVHDPETRRKMVGMQEYTLFQVTSTVRPRCKYDSWSISYACL